MALATIRGTALAPGISKNGRLYTRETIAGAVARAQGRIAAGRMVMKTHHDAGDDTTRVVGRVTSLRVAGDGSAQFEAELADTKHGRTIASLVTGPKPFVDGVSIRGAWASPVQRVKVGGQTVETAMELELDGIDFTHAPGVPAAVLTAETARDGRKLIFETAPGPVEPVAVPPAARDLAALSAEEFEAAAHAYWGGQFAASDARKDRSPWMKSWLSREGSE